MSRLEYRCSSKAKADFVSPWKKAFAMAGEWFFAPLRPGDTKGGWGAYCRKSGKCFYYSEGPRGDTEWFFEMGTGKPVFYLRDGRLNWVISPMS